MALLGNLNPYQGIGPMQQPAANVQPPQYAQQQPQALLGMQQMNNAFQQTQVPPVQVNAQQSQQQQQEYDVRAHMAQFLKSKEGQEVVNQFAKHPDFADILKPLQMNLDQEDSSGGY